MFSMFLYRDDGCINHPLASNQHILAGENRARRNNVVL